MPDRRLKEWKASNPKGYRALFEQRAKLLPRFRLTKGVLAETRAGHVESFPARMGLKGVLRRAVQLAKRHRDLHFAEVDGSLCPISVIITTLAANSYAYCVKSFEYDTEFDLLHDVFRYMPAFIEHDVVRGRKQWFVWNETTNGENFAEKWNTEPHRAEAFFKWHAEAEAGLGKMMEVEGLDRLTKTLSEAFGKSPVSKALTNMTESVSSARGAGLLSVTRGIGVTVGPGSGSIVRPNTFFGAP